MSGATSAQINFTQGPIVGQVVRFALPICAGNVLQQMYSTVDTLVVGNYCDAAALAAVATSSQPLEILLCVFLGIGSGISILVSQAAGAKDAPQLKRIVNTAVAFLFAAALPLTLLGLLLGPWLLRLMQVPADAMPYAVQYLRITTIGILGNMGYNFNAGILRGLGNSTSSLLLLGVACAVNIVLDLALTAGLGMGVSGVAWATAAALFLSWIFSILYIRRCYPALEFPVFTLRFDAGFLGRMLRIGLPLGLNSALYSVGHLMLQVIFNAQGSVFVAGCSVAGKVNGIANIAITSFSSSATVFAGQNLGAGRYDRLRRGAWRIPLCSGAITLAAGLTMTLFSRPLLGLFTPDSAVLDFAQRYIYVVLPFTWTYAIFNGIMSFANGIGEIRYPTVVNILLLWCVRIPAAYLLDWLGYGGWAMAGVPLSFVVGMIAMLFFSAPTAGARFAPWGKPHLTARPDAPDEKAPGKNASGTGRFLKADGAPQAAGPVLSSPAGERAGVPEVLRLCLFRAYRIHQKCKNGGCKARNRRNTWCISRLRCAADTVFS